MKYRCLVCEQIVDIPEGQELICPICGAMGDQLVPYQENETDSSDGTKNSQQKA